VDVGGLLRRRAGDAGDRPVRGRRRQAASVSFKEAASWSVVWVAVSLAFAGALWWYLDGAAGRESPTKRRSNSSPAT
jgi:hypothetical protein